MKFNILKKINIFQFKIEYIFLILAFIGGAISIIMTPPFQMPDENFHFFKSYQISDGQFVSIKQDNRIGGFIPKSIIEFTKKYEHIRFKFYQKTSFDSIKTDWNTELNAYDKEFIDFPVISVYSPLAYLPQATGIFVMRLLNLSPIGILYGARLFSLLFWISILFAAIKKIKAFKLILFVLALLPMSLFINSAVSADVITNALSFYTIALFMNLAKSNESISKTDTILLIILLCSIALTKFVYLTILGLVFIINKMKFDNNKKYFAFLTFVILIPFSIAFIWNSYATKKFYITHNQYNPQFVNQTIMRNECSNVDDQIDFIKQNPVKTFEKLTNSFRFIYISQYLGQLGWLDTFVVPAWFVIFFFIILFLILFWGDNNTKITSWERFVLIGIYLSSVIIILLSQFLTWDCTTSRSMTAQGRYFSPIVPLLFFGVAFYKNQSKYFVKILAIFFALTSIGYLYYTLRERYFEEQKYIQLNSYSINPNSKNKFDNSFGFQKNEKFYLSGKDTIQIDVSKISKYKESVMISVQIWSKELNDTVVLFDGTELKKNNIFYTDSIESYRNNSFYLLTDFEKKVKNRIMIFKNSSKDSLVIDSIKVVLYKYKRLWF